MGYMNFKMRYLLFVFLFVLASCSTYQGEGTKLYNEALMLGKEQSEAFEESTTFGDAYAVLKKGLRKDSYPTRRRMASFFLPEMEDYEIPIVPEEKPDYAKLKAEREAAKTAKKIYCYKSMAKADCFPAPIKGQEFRLVGVKTIKN